MMTMRMDLLSGSTMRTMVANGDAPSMDAASRSAEGTELMK